MNPNSTCSFANSLYSLSSLYLRPSPLQHNGNAWDSDPEVEEFANTLAEKMMEDAGNGTTHFDKKNPKSEDQGDLYAD